MVFLIDKIGKKVRSKMQVKLIIADLKKITFDEQWILTQIAQGYVEKYHSHKKKEDKKQELIAGYLLKKYLGIDHSEQLVWKEGGKPILRNENQHFNLSHSGKYVVLAIADQEIGVDIERIRPYHEATSKKVFSLEMQKQLSTTAEKERNQLFTRLWTELEAKLKVRGIGFGKEWESEKEKEFFVETRKVDDYFISIASEQEMKIETGWLDSIL